MRKRIITTVLLSSLIFLYGCKTLTTCIKVAANGAAIAGVIPGQAASAIGKTAEAADKAFEGFTPSQEYYLGRTVAATLLSDYKVYNNRKALAYINVLGQTLAKASDRPDTYAGYHFLIIDSDEVNAFAAPGGLILVSRGLIRCCVNEDCLASVLAHEIAHIQLEHGINAINKSRYIDLMKTLAFESMKVLGSEQLAFATTTLEKTTGDIVSTIANKGFAPSDERKADLAALEIMKRVGYNPRGLKMMLDEMNKRYDPNGHGFFSTHPKPQDRLDNIESSIASYGDIINPAPREKRFKTALAGI